MAWVALGPFKPGDGGECPHCGKGVQFTKAYRKAAVHPGADSETIEAEQIGPKGDEDQLWIEFSACPLCQRVIVYGQFEPLDMGAKREVLLWPRSREASVPDEVPGEIASTYREAAEVLPVSAKASAALSRRCLERTLVEGGGVAENLSLSDMIKEVIPKLPSYLADDVDHIRAAGNFAAHPIKSEESGVVVEVEPGEAEWNLEVLDELFDHYFVKPEKAGARREQMNRKRDDAGKPPLHSSDNGAN